MLVDDLRAALADDAVLEDPDVVASYARDQSNLTAAGKPSCVVLPRTTGEVAAALQVAAAHRTPVVPRGAGSGLSGGANGIDGGMVLCLSRMTEIRDISETDLLAVVQPGVLNGDLKDALAPAGLWYPPDPASAAFCSLGGNVATNAGGLCCVKYGVTGDYVLGLEVVLADGTTLHTGRRTRKGVAGYDLTRLFVGSEGTLGVITEATLRLVTKPPAPSILVAFFDTLEAAGEAVREMTAVGPSLLELMDHQTIVAVDDWKNIGLDRDAAVLLLAASDAPGPQAAIDTAAMAAHAERAGASYVAHTSDPLEGEQLLAARKLAYPALERLGTPLLDDVAIPLSRVPDFLAAVAELQERCELPIATFGHAGDGNMHPTIVFDPLDPQSVQLARVAFDAIVLRALDLGGTVTGEHGVGTLKTPYLARELDPAARAVQRSIKKALDPYNLLNPGRAIA